ncbi:MAG: hypothetical protein SH848_00345 [Saprospiraceae bacterium]|nr:hypothetical protein [Saprospiraceae bacterium]MDZ4702345.1 hypothetical protein [Saprospiraceae bacterium]
MKINQIIWLFNPDRLSRTINTVVLIIFSFICAGKVFTFAPNYYLFALLLAIANGCYSVRVLNYLDAFIVLITSFTVMQLDPVTARGLITFPGAILLLYTA